MVLRKITCGAAAESYLAEVLKQEWICRRPPDRSYPMYIFIWTYNVKIGQFDCQQFWSPFAGYIRIIR
jgi:hypothetical protein